MKRKDNKVVIEVDSKNHGVNVKLVVLIVLLLIVIAVMVFIYHKKKSQPSLTDVAGDVVEEVQEAVTEFVDEQIIGEEGEVTTITEAEIKEVFEIAELETADYIYNAVVHVSTSDGSAVKYHVAYQGTVTAGINFDEIELSVDNEQKIIYIKMPPVTILYTVVDSGKLQYIFEDDKYDNETVFSEAYSACQKDLDSRSASERALLDLADENAKQVIEALVRPWVEQIDEEYVISWVTD